MSSQKCMQISLPDSRQRDRSYLLLHHNPSDGSLDHVGPVQTVHTVHSEDSLLLTNDSSLIHPDREEGIQFLS